MHGLQWGKLVKTGYLCRFRPAQKPISRTALPAVFHHGSGPPLLCRGGRILTMTVTAETFHTSAMESAESIKSSYNYIDSDDLCSLTQLSMLSL